jgi:hypothetical protein
MSSDTNVNWFLIRILANTLIDPSDPTSLPKIVNNVQHNIFLNTLREFEQNGHQPVPPPGGYDTPPATQEEICEAAPFHNLPKCAVEFFEQLGRAVVLNPIPDRDTGLSGTPLNVLERLAPWMAPQAGAHLIYFVPSYGQRAKLDSFAPLGLTENGFTIPDNWGQAQLEALQCGYEHGQQDLTNFINDFPAGQRTNYWGILNDPVGTYPNNDLGYLFRSLIVVEGGVANIALDGVYPTLFSITPTPAPSGTPIPLDGNNTYKITFVMPTPSASPCASPNAQYPISGIYPPMVPDPNNNNNPLGFWSIHVYATDPTEATAPFIAQTSLQNLYYSTVDTAVLRVDPAHNTMTVRNPNWGRIISSTPIRFGDNAADYGLLPDTVYYAVCPDGDTGPGCPNPGGRTSTFQISTQWIQQLSADPSPVPIQGPGGQPGSIVPLPSPSPGASPLQHGMVKPVTQLGSTQYVANQLVTDGGSLTLWFGPTLPAGAPASNWIPTPNTAYYTPIYGPQISTAFQLTLRMYYPMPGDRPPSILNCLGPNCDPQVLTETYIPPAVECVSGPTCP